MPYAEMELKPDIRHALEERGVGNGVIMAMTNATPPMHVRPHRRTTRALLRIAIIVKGTTTSGHAFQEETHTVTVDGHGAQIVLKNSARPGGRLMITNLRSGESSVFRLVRRGTDSFSKAAEWGVECLQPGTNFWGMYFPASAPPPLPAEAEIIEGLLECQRCGSKEFAHLTLELYKTLARRSFLKRECIRCGAPTEWGYSFADDEEEFLVEPMPALRPAPSTGGSEKRQARRLAIKLPVRIRLDNGQEETAGTENLSKIGVCFISEARMKAGDNVRLVFATTGLGSRTEILARVVRRQELEGTNRFIYGVRLEKRAYHRVARRRGTAGLWDLDL